MDAINDGSLSSQLKESGESLTERLASITAAVEEKYALPVGGIPLGDLSENVKNRLIARDAGGLFITES